MHVLAVLAVAGACGLASALAPRGLAPAVSNSSLRPRNYGALDLCPTCVQFTGQAIDVLLNLILNGGVVGTCGTLCGALQQKTGSAALGAVCNILCDIAGVEEFVKLIQKADLDPIYFCELLKTCPINDNGDATITGLSVDPTSGPQGPRTISFTLNSKNGTGTGELILAVETVDGIPVEDGVLVKAQNATAFPAPQAFKLKAEVDPDCDPTQGPCEMWLPGNYSLRVDVCNGECGSNHPHSKIYDSKTIGFEITQ